MKIGMILGLLWLFLPAHGEAAIYRGYSAIENTLSERLLQDGETFSFNDRYLAGQPGVDTSALMKLLGAYDGNTGNNEFQNGDPNVVNMLLWEVLLQLTASDIARYCSRDSKLPLHPYFRAVLDPLCAWPAPSAKTEANLRPLWTALTGYDATEEELAAWEQFALTSSLAAKPATEALSTLVFLALYNPHFLLRK